MARPKRSKNKTVKKREYNKRNIEIPEIDTSQQFNSNYRNLEEKSEVETRASENSYVFICGNKVLIQNLSDETLNERLDQTFISACEARRQTNQLEELEYNLSLEQRYRGLK